MSNFDKDLVATNLQKAKDEERMRSARVQIIIKDAIAEAVSEVKEGSSQKC